MRVKVAEDTSVKIYELRDPRDLECKSRYVGITIKPLNYRLSAHLSPRSLNTKTHKNNWIKDLISLGISPTIHLIEEVVGWTYACEVERYYIKEFKEQGYNLTNTTNGGEGSIGIVPRQETLDKLSIATSGENNPMHGKSGELSPVWGRKHTDDEKQRIKDSNRKALAIKETAIDFGISTQVKNNRFVTAIWLDSIKYSLGTYGKKEDAIKVLNEIKDKRYIETPITPKEIEDIVKKHTEIEWCRKLLLKNPAVNYKPELKKWCARISYGGIRYYLGLFDTKELGEEAYNKEANKLIISILFKYNINIKDI